MAEKIFATGDFLWYGKHTLQDFCRIIAGFLQDFSSVLKNEELMQNRKIVIFFGCIVFFTSRKRKWVFILLLPQMGPLLSHDALIKFVLYYICTYCFKNIYKHGQRTQNEGINQRNLKCLGLKCQKICFGAIFILRKGLRVFWGFIEPPTHLRKDIFTT